jgi:hypothetical protein
VRNANALRWDGRPGHYEVHCLTFTDPATGIGLRIRYTLRAPATGGPAEAALVFSAVDTAGAVRFARRESFAIDRLRAEDEPFRLAIADNMMTETGMRGGVGDARWELSWQPRLAPYDHLRERWSRVHCNDFVSIDGERRSDTFVNGVSAVIQRLGQEIGPSTSVIGRFDGADFASTSPLALARNTSRLTTTSWRFEARDGKRRVAGEVDAPSAALIDVAYEAPDGAPVHCYNSEVASMRLLVSDKAAGGGHRWVLRDTLVSPGRAHFEYGQGGPVPDLEVHVR